MRLDAEMADQIQVAAGGWGKGRKHFLDCWINQASMIARGVPSPTELRTRRNCARTAFPRVTIIPCYHIPVDSANGAVTGDPR